MAGSKEQPKSWGELLNTHRDSWGSRTFATATPAHTAQVRYTRNVPDICPLAELKHPLYPVGNKGRHTVNAADGSAQRSRWHGWGDVTLLKQDGFKGQPHPRSIEVHGAAGKRSLAAPCSEGRHGLFGLLSGAEAGGVDSWMGNIQVDPCKGKRWVPPPTDAARAVDMRQLLAQTAPGTSASDAWLGHTSIDPSKGKGRAPDPAALRGRTDLFSILQQQVLWPQPAADAALSSGGASSGTHTHRALGASSAAPAAAVDGDAWLGNRLIEPHKGKKPVGDSPAAGAALHGGVFREAALDGCWCDLPPIGKRPLPPPSAARNFVTAAQTMAIEVPLPPSAVVGPGRPQGKAILQHQRRRAGVHASSSSGGSSGGGANSSSGGVSAGPVDMYALMTYRPLTVPEAVRWSNAWTDAAVQPRKKPPPVGAVAASASSPSLQVLIAAQQALPVRCVPHVGGIAQEIGMGLDTILANRAMCKAGRQGGPPGASSSGGSGGKSGSGSGGAARSGRAAQGAGCSSSKSGGRRA